MGRNRALGTPFEVATISSSQTTEAHIDMYAVDAAPGSPVTLILDPNAFNGDQVVIQDVGDNASEQPIVVQASPGQTILNGFGTSISVAISGSGVQLTFDQNLGGWIPQMCVCLAPQQITTPSTVVVDPINGNDATASGPFKTVARLNAYLAGAKVSGTDVLTVQFTSSPPATDEEFAPIGLNFIDGATMLVMATPTIVHTGTLTAGTTALNPPTNTRETLVDSALASWAPYQYLLVRDTTQDSSTWIALAPSANTATVGQPATNPVTPNTFASPSIMTAGDSYQIETRVTIALGTWLVYANDPVNVEDTVIFQDLNIAADCFMFMVDENDFYLFRRCAFFTEFGFDGASPITCENCAFLGPIGSGLPAFLGAGQLYANFGLMVTNGEEFAQPLVNVKFGGHCYVTGFGLAANGASSVEVTTGLQVQDTTGLDAAINGPFDSAGSVVWGSGNAGAGIAVSSPVFVATTNTYVTGAAGDFIMATTFGGFANVAFAFNIATGAYISPPIACSWANLFAPTPAGFGGGAHRPENNSHIMAG
jgi:hypothetical protein